MLLRMGWPVVTLVMGVVLGEIMENRLRQTLSLGEGSLMILFQRPICLVLLVLTVLTIAVPLIRDTRKARQKNGPPPL
jgi:putative tricarboxylic transport membrane protein